MPNPPKSLEQKSKQGTLRADRMPDNPIVPRKTVEVPKPPKKYSPAGEHKFARQRWKEICTYLLNENRLMDTDHELIELLVDAWVQYNLSCEAIKTAQDQGSFVRIQTNQGGGEYESLTVWWRVYKESQEQIRKLSNDLGLTPASRNRIGMPSGTKEENSAASLRSALYGHGPGIN